MYFMAKVAVTGGAGFIGSNIVDLLLASGHSVEVFDDLSSGSASNLPKHVPLHRLDIRSPDAKQLIARLSPDIVIHAAAQISVRVSMENPLLDTDVNVLGLVNILDAFAGHTYPYFILLSSGGAIYGEQEFSPASESHPVRPESPYGLAKRVDEMYLELWGRLYKMPWVALRLANVYGPRQNPHGEAGVVARFIRQLLHDEQPVINGDGTQSRDFVYVGDVAAAVRAVCETRVTGIYNIGTSHETSVNELYDVIRARVGSKLNAQYAEAKSGEQMRSSIDPSHAERTFGWRSSVKIDEGIMATVQWFEHQMEPKVNKHLAESSSAHILESPAESALT